MLELTIRLVVSLAIVVGLLLLLARFGARRFRGTSGSLVQVVHRQPLSRTSAVAVVSVGSRVLVLGTTEQQVSVLAELDPDEVDDVVLDGDAEGTQADFAGVLHQALDGAQAAEAEPADAQPAKPVTPPRPQARPATKPPTWDPHVALRAQLPVRPAQAPRRPATTDATTEPAEPEQTEQQVAKPTEAVESILAAIEAHQNGQALPPALAVLASEKDAPTNLAPTTPAAKTKSPRRLRLSGAQAGKQPRVGTGPLAGSVLSPDTWKQAIAAATSRRAS